MGRALVQSLSHKLERHPSTSLFPRDGVSLVLFILDDWHLRMPTITLKSWTSSSTFHPLLTVIITILVWFQSCLQLWALQRMVSLRSPQKRFHVSILTSSTTKYRRYCRNICSGRSLKLSFYRLFSYICGG